MQDIQNVDKLEEHPEVAELRRDYRQGELSETSLDPDPIAQFRLWFDQACQAKLTEPNAMTLATCGCDGQPNARTVLLKAYDARGFVFYTNYESRKGQEIAENAKVALLFPWLELERQVKIQGHAERVSHAESLAYFLSRPKGSRLGAWVSQQSRVISKRSLLEQKLAKMKARFADGDIPLPDFWGGIRVVAHRLEFWQGRQNRLHDRLQYTREGETNWHIERLQP